MKDALARAATAHATRQNDGDHVKLTSIFAATATSVATTATTDDEEGYVGGITNTCVATAGAAASMTAQKALGDVTASTCTLDRCKVMTSRRNELEATAAAECAQRRGAAATTTTTSTPTIMSGGLSAALKRVRAANGATYLGQLKKKQEQEQDQDQKEQEGEGGDEGSPLCKKAKTEPAVPASAVAPTHIPFAVIDNVRSPSTSSDSDATVGSCPVDAGIDPRPHCWSSAPALAVPAPAPACAPALATLNPTPELSDVAKLAQLVHQGIVSADHVHLPYNDDYALDVWRMHPLFDFRLEDPNDAEDAVMTAAAAAAAEAAVLMVNSKP